MLAKYEVYLFYEKRAYTPKVEQDTRKPFMENLWAKWPNVLLIHCQYERQSTVYFRLARYRFCHLVSCKIIGDIKKITIIKYKLNIFLHYCSSLILEAVRKTQMKQNTLEMLQ